MKVYLAGPMRGIPQFNFPTFHTWTKWLRAQGHEVFSPAERDVERHGVDISADNATGSSEEAAARYGFSIRVAFGEDLAWICAHADAIAMVPGWVRSKGAVAEKATAEALGLKVILLEDAQLS